MKIISNDIEKISLFLLGTGLATLVTYLINYKINTALSKEELGSFFHIFNLLNMAFPLVVFGLHLIPVRFYQEVEIEEWAKVFIVAFYCAAFFAVITYAYTGEISYSLFLFASVHQLQVNILKSDQRVVRYNIFTLLPKLCVLLFIVFVSNAATVDNIILAYGLSYSFAVVLLVFVLRKSIPISIASLKISSNCIVFDKKILIYSLWSLCLVMISWVSIYANQYIINYFYTEVEVAEYAVATRLVMTVSLISTTFLLYYPVIYFKYMKSGDYEKIRLIRILFFCFFILIVSGFIIFKKNLYLLFGAEKYLDSIELFVFLIIGEFFRVSASVFLIYRTYKLQQSVNVMVVMFVIIFNVTITFFFIEDNSVFFASKISMIANFIYFIMSLFFSYRQEVFEVNEKIRFNS